MSYILDALNKSEQERERKQITQLKNLRDDRPQGRFQLKHFLYLLALLVLLNSIGVYLYFGNNQPKVSTTPTSDNTAATALKTLDTSANLKAPAAETSGSFSETVFPGAAVTINSLPDHVARRLPEIQITAHIYGSDPDLRMVNIDGISRREGDLVSHSLQLVEITETGVVMNFEGYAYILDIIEAWQNSP